MVSAHVNTPGSDSVSCQPLCSSSPDMMVPLSEGVNVVDGRRTRDRHRRRTSDASCTSCDGHAGSVVGKCCPFRLFALLPDFAWARQNQNEILSGHNRQVKCIKLIVK